MTGSPRNERYIMANVYENIKKFYKKKIPPDREVIKRQQTEKYFRRRAWSGITDAELQEEWLVLQEVVRLFANLNINLVENPETVEILEILYRAYIDRKRSITTDILLQALETISRFLLSVFDYDAKYIENLVVQTQHSFFEHGYFAYPLRPPAESFVSIDEYGEDDIENFNKVLDEMMGEMQEYFSAPRYNSDLMRAAMFFLRSHADREYLANLPEEVWFNFWDYFLFDYHIQKSDVQPIKLYYEENRNKMSEEERILSADLMRMRFRVFYIVRYDEEGVLCSDLFTDEEFDMPWPDNAVGDYRQMLFFGHLETKGLVMLNYIASFMVSPKLRQRIKHEILRLYELYRLQRPGATLEDFFIRHAISVRHIIQILTGYARLNVVPNITPPKSYPPEYGDLSSEFMRMESELRGIGLACGLSSFASCLLVELYQDFFVNSSLRESQKLSTDVLWAVLCAYLGANFGDPFAMAEPIKKMGADMKQVKKMYAAVSKTLDLRPFDPRYAAEEGYVLSLVSPVV